jgi:hypothetical protein
MALSYLIRTQNASQFSASDTCFTKQNYHTGTDMPNDLFSAATPVGVLGGSVAMLSNTGVDATDEYTVVPGTGAVGTRAVGLFVNNASGRPWEMNQAEASGKITVAKGKPSVEVDVYETYEQNKASGASAGSWDLISYNVGDALYCSVNGLLTNEAAPNGQIIGYVTKAPSVNSLALGLDVEV